MKNCLCQKIYSTDPPLPLSLSHPCIVSDLGIDENSSQGIPFGAPCGKW